MKMKKRTAELQASYQAMIDAVEEFVVKEGKTLQQAFHAAEKTLHDAKEVSKEQIEQTSKDLKNNLRVFSEAAEGVSEAYKEQIMFDFDYVSKSIWDKFQSIANSNTVELMAFAKDLREQAKTALTDEHTTAHQEHNQWSSEHALWLDEVEFWNKEHKKALTKLVEIEKSIKQQSSVLQEHVQAIQAHTKLEHEHEKTMKNSERDFSSKAYKEADVKENPVHQQERKMHAQESAKHHALKTHHFKVMAMINILHKETQKVE